MARLLLIHVVKMTAALERFQKSTCRRILNIYDHSVSYSELLSRLRLESIYRYVFAERLSLVHAYIRKFRHFPSSVITFKSTTGLRNSARTNNDYAAVIPPCKFDCLNNSSLISSLVAFNTLQNTHIEKSKSAFRKFTKSDKCFNSVTNDIKHFRSKIIEHVKV